MELCNPTVVRDLLERHGFSFSKSLGQNFLIDANIVRNIALASGADKNIGVVEVGPGFGVLTAELAKLAGHVVTVEIDKSILPVLKETLADFDNITVFNSDILKVDLDALLAEQFPQPYEKYHVCANLPYYITTPVLAMLIESGKFDSITIMIQKEVAYRLAAKAGTADYGAFSVFTQFYTDAEINFTVSSSCFMPRPKVDSAVVTMRMKKEFPLEESLHKLYFRVVKGAFAQRRKTLLNSIGSVFGGQLNKEQLSACIADCGFDLRVRGETLTIEDFARLTKRIDAEMRKQ